jgi:excinuclease ABC subunit C
MTKLKIKPDNKLKEKLKAIPPLSGIYQFKDKTERIIYIGKAKNLRTRVQSYFRSTVDSPKTLALVKKINDFQLIITDNEIEALVLENNLIKQFKPRYNINLKDDKTFPYIRVTNEPYPRIFSTRQIIRDGSKYFGPYTNVRDMKTSLRMINQTFKIRSCKHKINDEIIAKGKIKLCLDYHIKKCDGPCRGLVSEEEYNKMVLHVIKVLKGKSEVLIKELTEEMNKAAKDFNFEKAAELRDTIKKLELYSSKQKIVSTDFSDKDVITVAIEEKDVACTILNIREGRLVGKKQLHLSCLPDDELPKVYASVIKFYYNEFVEIPKEIIIETTPEEEKTILSWLKKISGKKIKFVVPKIQSDTMSLLKMCKQNSILQLGEIQLQKMKKEGNLPYVLQALKRDLRLNTLPRKIECFDISHIQGSETVASLVVFVDGKPKKSLYRKFIIKTVKGIDDFASMKEVVERRYSKIAEGKNTLPDLIMVDGGKGQLSSAVQILKELGFKKFNIIGLAKRLEEIFFPNNSEAQTIPKTSSSLKLLQQIRDEAHRFAITFHRERRSKRTFHTELTEIKGIGEKIAAKLLIEFKSVKEIKQKNIEELSNIIGKAKGETVYYHYHKKRKP